MSKLVALVAVSVLVVQGCVAFPKKDDRNQLEVNVHNARVSIDGIKNELSAQRAALNLLSEQSCAQDKKIDRILERVLSMEKSCAKSTREVEEVHNNVEHVCDMIRKFSSEMDSNNIFLDDMKSALAQSKTRLTQLEKMIRQLEKNGMAEKRTD